MKRKFTILTAALLLLTLIHLPGNAVGQTRDTKTDIMFAKGFAGYTTNSYSAAGTDRTAVANSTNATGVTYAMQVFNGSQGTVRGNQSGAANYSCRNTTTYNDYYISSVTLTITGGTLKKSDGRSLVYFGSSAYANPNTTAPTGTSTTASLSSDSKTLTWTNTDESVSHFILYNLETSGNCYSADADSPLTVVWTSKTPASSVATPQLSKGTSYCDEEQSITITCDTEGATIHYTLDGTEPTSASTTYSGAISITETITLRAVAIKDEESSTEASATYTFVSTLKTMNEIYAAATTAGSTATTVYIHFNNFVISAINSGTSTVAYLTDGTYGCYIYGEGHGFVAGKILNGIASCSLKKYNEMSYITGLTASSPGLVITDGGTVTPVVTTIDALSGINAGSVVRLNGLTWDGTNFSDGTNTIKNSTAVFTATSLLTTGNVYDITGVLDYDTYGKRINPRSAADVVPGTATTLPFSWAGGVKSDLLALQGVTAYGLGSGYTDTHGLYRVQFDDTGDYIMVRTDSQPDVVTIGVKKIGGAGNSTITVQGSSDGVTFDEGQALTISGNSNAIVNLTSTRSFGEDVRYVKLLFTKSANVGVGPISITKNAPTITVSTSSISGFNYIDGHGPSASQNFTVSGIHLTDNLVVTASSHYEVCKTVDGTYESSVSYEPASGSVATSTVYVRLKAGLSAGSYATDDDKITVSSTGADSKTVSLSGSVTPTYTLTSVVDPENSGTVTLGAASLVAGSTTTATASANAGYKFTGWSISGTGASLSSTSTNPTTVTMGTADATITATFEAVMTNPIHWSVNGTIVKTDNVEENAAITFAAPTSGVPSGFVFQGWIEETIAGTQNTAPEYVTSASSTAEKTYYAVMAIGSEETATLTASHTTNNTTYADHTYTDDKGNTWSGNTNEPYENTQARIGLRSTNGSYLESPTFPSNVSSIKIMTFNSSSSDRAFDLKSTKAGTSADLGTVPAPKNTKLTAEQTATLTGASFNKFFITVADPLGFSYIKVTYGAPTNFCTTINTFTTAGNWNDNTKWSWGAAPTTEPSVNIGAACTIPNGTIANVNNIIIADGGSLVIEDGGQLITSNAVAATVEKEIVGFGSVNTVQTGWYTIASPITTSITPSSDMLQETYDLYYYDEADDKWYNYRPNNEHSGFNIEPNKGYLYANSGNTTLSFSGTVRASNASVSMPLSYASSDENLKGLNLVGNPYTCELDSETNIMLGTVNFSAYYIADGTVNAQGKNLIACEISERNIKPCEGFIVQATAADQNLVFNGRGRSEQNGYLRITAGNNDFTDRAYVHFGNANTLRKMTISDNTAKVYVMQDGKDYAAATIEEAQGEMPVSFRANENGQYTLTVNVEDVDMNYLHLIDNMTGADIDLLATPSYTFNAKTTDYESRFRLVFAANNEDGSSTGSETFSFFSNGNWIISNEGEATLQVIDITGRILSSETVNGSVSKNIDAQAGMYVLRLINGDSVRTQKIVVR